MTEREPSVADITESLRSILKAQYHASLEMLKEAIERCPDELWLDSRPANAFWQIAYHTLFFTHLYMGPDEAAFVPWHGHQADVQHPDGIAGPADPESALPLVPEPYSKEQVLEYWKICDDMVEEVVDTLDLYGAESGFWWYKVPKLEHQIINIRHIQHGAAQLADRVRAAADVGINWAGSRPKASIEPVD